MKRKLQILFLILLLTSTVSAQQNELMLHLYGCMAQPVGDFGRDIDYYTHVTRRAGFQIGENIGLARIGMSGGAELIAPIWFRGLNWVLNTKIIVNGVKSGVVLDKFRSEFVGDTVTAFRVKRSVENIDLEYGYWINIPVMTGFRYDYHFSHKYTMYGTIMAGANISKAFSRKATVEMKSLEGTIESFIAEDTKYTYTIDFGFEVGLGFVFNQTYNLGLRYLSLSTPRYGGMQQLSEKVFPKIYALKNEIIGEKRSVSVLLVTFGIQLFR